MLPLSKQANTNNINNNRYCFYHKSENIVF